MTEAAFVDPTRAAFDLFKSLPRDEPIWMLNLVRYRPLAIYPADHPDANLGRTGEEAYQEYGRTSDPIFSRLGGKVVWRGTMQVMLTGPESEAWDTIFIANYPSAGAFLAMVTDADYREAVKHRQAAVLTSRLVRCQQQDASGGFA
ncbi:DUF1330 domain-containing protein [Aquidulcibacter sp.]|uniref:DUF1330 domain-containing protein n=1 Tax=Aquidulcibacter sp. TaxID=2052990 RepID=UPI0025BB5F8D|nr:DUF1330 domain-containing protein [Aquidulcibacter sp.]MCA3696054.1 DUF1330 domain-containing protein [Aquidulcibacter sp.]